MISFTISKSEKKKPYSQKMKTVFDFLKFA